MWQQYGPEAAVNGVNKKAFYDAKFGKDKWKSFMPRLSQVTSFPDGCFTGTTHPVFSPGTLSRRYDNTP